MSKAIQWEYKVCANCLRLLTDLYFNNSDICYVCAKNKGE